MMGKLELPTWLVAAGAYGGWALLCLHYAALPPWLVLPAAALLMALHGSLQHEAIHGHPTRWPRINAIIAGVPLGLWLPFSLYRESHLAHHRCKTLTDPFGDPESYYVSAERWAGMGPFSRAVHWIMSTLLGRLLVGPPVMIGRFFAAEAARLLSGDLTHLRTWLIHGAASALLLAWVTGVCGIPLGAYLVLFVYPGLSLTMLRSFIEHRPAKDRARATAIVEAGPILSLVFLHNNLHALHHDEPNLAWYELPRRYRELKPAILAGNGGFIFSGYAEVFLRFALRPKDAPIHPLEARGAHPVREARR